MNKKFHELDKLDRNMTFLATIDDLMGKIRTQCYRKVVADRGLDPDDEEFDLMNFKVTKRQVADSLDHLPVSIRSAMVTAAQSYFNAIHEA